MVSSLSPERRQRSSRSPEGRHRRSDGGRSRRSPTTRSRRSPSPSHRSRRSRSPQRRSKESVSPDYHNSRRKRSASAERSKRKDNPDKDNKSGRRRYRSTSRDSKERYRSDRRKRSYSSSSSSSSSSEDEKRKRSHKKHKKDKKKKKSKKKSKKSKMRSVGEEWGKYGIIHDADIFTKEAEFQAWLIEVKNADVETLNNVKRKEMFVDFMEDYNTATMPHEKFYDIAKWESRQRSLRMGERPSFAEGNFDFGNDEEKLRLQHKQAARIASSNQPVLQLSSEQLEELSRVSRERVEADRMRKMGLKPKETMGLRYDEELM